VTQENLTMSISSQDTKTSSAIQGSRSLTADAAIDQSLHEAQTKYLAKRAPGTTSRRVRWSGGETQLLELGDGPPVLLIHGGLGEAFQWAPIMPLLARRFHVYAVDRPGHGLSDPFNYRNVDYRAHMEGFVAEIMDALNLHSAPIVANSMGGTFAVYFALRYPERVSRLVLIGAPAGTKRELPFAMRALRMPLLSTLIQSFMRKPTRASVLNFYNQFTIAAHPERLDDEFLDAVVRSQKRNLESWMGILERFVDPGGFRREVVIGERWKQLRVPTLFIWGEKDPFGTPANGETIAAQIPAGARLVRIPDAGHLPWIDEPERCATQIMDFLKP
jgi:pimeloyl-ACP methyl ester carboxylesterase